MWGDGQRGRKADIEVATQAGGVLAPIRRIAEDSCERHASGNRISWVGFTGPADWRATPEEWAKGDDVWTVIAGGHVVPLERRIA